MLRYRDFVPTQDDIGVFAAGKYESFDEALERANAWISENGIQAMNIETVVLPNLWSRMSEGSTDISREVSSFSSWNQFIRVWSEMEIESGGH